MYIGSVSGTYSVFNNGCYFYSVWKMSLLEVRHKTFSHCTNTTIAKRETPSVTHTVYKMKISY